MSTGNLITPVDRRIKGRLKPISKKDTVAG